jgi:cellulose synthase/poly-beta-1,6-N-acetylglucosamine synthase-like glycosyltransferase
VIITYLGYGICILCIAGVKTILGSHREKDITAAGYEPEITMFVAAYNEIDFIKVKIDNTFEINYPKEKIHYLWITDGSDDGTPEFLRKYPEFVVLHNPERKGKISAINRGMMYVKTPVVIFSDCNSLLVKDSVRIIAAQFNDEKVGCVSGEKSIKKGKHDSASGAGEGFYWKYESLIKKSESVLCSTVGAVGELFAIRTSLYTEIPEDTILDDFIISMKIAMAGYRIQYCPGAIAIETASVSIKEEMVRKVRISAGAFQSISRLKDLLNPFRYGFLSIEYFFHKFLRWAVAPFALLMILPLNIILLPAHDYLNIFYTMIFILQILFYLLVMAGWVFENNKLKFKQFFLPYYFFVMNLSVYIGIIRYLRGNQSVKWQKAKRS